MQRKWWYIASLGIGLSIGVSVLILVLPKPSPSISSGAPVVHNEVSPSPSSTIAATKLWDDLVGFTFSYPEDVEVNAHPEDQENYAHVELTHASHPGKLVVWAKDLPLNKKGQAITSLDEWVKTIESPNISILNTTLSETPAKKLFYTSPAMLQVGTIFDELLFLVETELTDKEYWTKVHAAVVDSFSFKPIAGSGSDVEAVAVDEEEVIE